MPPTRAGTIEQGRPTKRDRRELAEWQRWSASIDDNDADGPPRRAVARSLRMPAR